MPAPVTLLLVDDHPLLRDGVRIGLERVPGLRVVGEADGAADALPLVARLAPDLVVTDIGLDGMNGLHFAEVLRERHPAVAVMVLTMHDHPDYVRQARESGARGYVLKQAPIAELREAVREVASGGTWFRPTLEAGHERRAAQLDPALDDRLTPRERDTLAWIAQGYSSKRIAAQLDVSERTVETYRHHIKRKLGLAGGHAELVKYAVEHRLGDRHGPQR